MAEANESRLGLVEPACDCPTCLSPFATSSGGLVSPSSPSRCWRSARAPTPRSFRVVRGVLLRPLAFPEPDRLVAVGANFFISNEEMDYWRTRTRSFEHIAAISPGWMMGLVAEGGEPIKVTGGRVSDNMFQTLGARAALGRTIEPGDAKPGAPQVVVISSSLWRTRFNSDRNVIGRGIQLDEQPNTIVGVMPDGFEIFGRDSDLWSALPWDPSSRNHKATFSLGVGRLARGVTPEAATREIADLAPAMRKDLAKANDWGQTLRVQSLRESITGDVRPALLILLGAVGLILMLAAVNLGTLVLGRSIERVGEMALRTALGASRGRLVRQIVIEQAVLATAGAIAGIAVAYALMPILIARIPAEVPRLGEITLDWTVLATRAGRLGERGHDGGAPAGGDHGAPELAAAAAPVADHRYARRAVARSARSSPCRLASPWCSASARC